MIFVEKSEILEASLEAMAKIVSRQQNPALGYVHVQGRQHLIEYFKENRDVKYPFFAVILESMGLNRESYHSKTLKRDGILASYDEENSVYYVYRVKPVFVNVTLRFFFRSFQSEINFIQDWLYKDRDLNFELVQGSFPISVKLSINDDIQIPEITLAETGEFFELETVVRMETYVGEVYAVKGVTSLNVNLNVPVTENDKVTSFKIDSYQLGEEQINV